MRHKRGPYAIQRHEVVQPLDQSYRLIPLTRGQNAIVDVQDFEWLSKWNWFAHWSESSGTFYAERREAKESAPSGKSPQMQVKMHRVILNCGPCEEADHRNHNGLDNRRENLRRCTKTQNSQNRRCYKSSKSRRRGVYPYGNRWQAAIQSNGVRKRLGIFDSIEDAAAAYREAAFLLHKQFANP
jgi:hypothetical protein